MASAASINPWKPCTVDGCAGSPSSANGRCLAHLAPSDLAVALDEIGREGKVDARGVEIGNELLHRIIGALPSTSSGATFTGDARLDGATFEGDASFVGATFEGDASFDGATFTGEAQFFEATFGEGDALFVGATFKGNARFDRTTFTGNTWFGGTTFTGDAPPDGASFGGDADFTGATFAGNTRFDGATFTRHASFSGAGFSEGVSFNGATFAGDAQLDASFIGYSSFTLATFSANANFMGATFEGNARFHGATFTGNARFDSGNFRGDALFEGAIFSGNASFDAATFAAEARFGYEFDFGPATFRGRASFDGATFTGNAWFGGTTFTGDAPFYGASFGGDADFTGATFAGDAGFHGATFTRNASFSGAGFSGGVSFHEATFTGDAQLDASFIGHASFSLATFSANANFAGAAFEGYAQFAGATFTGDASFVAATFTGYAWFEGATFMGDASFDAATFPADARFGGATFMGDALFERTSFPADARFNGVTFERARAFGPVFVLGMLDLADASFRERADLDLVADQLSLSRATFPQGANISVRWADIILDKAEFGASSVLAQSSEFEGLRESELVEGHKASRVRSEHPRLLTMRWATVENLTVSRIDLSPCRFLGAYHLDGLRIEGDSTFALTPSDPRVTKRQAIAEEREWRRDHRTFLSTANWQPPECNLPQGVTPLSPLTPKEIAAIYRDLRKGREDNKDEPGAADFYYGEMEMRRHDASASSAERVIIWLYWLVSGYGLRASRALLSLLVTVLFFGTLLYFWGFPSERSFLSAVTFSAESTTSLFRAPDRPLTLAGEWLQIGLRLLGPLFFGLALLSLRGRVKR